MRYTTLGKTGLRISVIGFGGIPIRRVGRSEAIQIVSRAVDLGVTFFDTARRYADSEEKMGEALVGRRDKVVLATKTREYGKEGAAADVEQSLRNLRTDYIDLYQIHNVSKSGDLARILAPGGAVEALVEAKKAGKIGHIGVTSHSRDVAVDALKTGVFETLMLPFSFLEPEAEEKVLPLCRDLNIGFIDMKPFAGGALDTAVQCLKWVLNRGVTVTIPGIGALSELEEDVTVADTDWTVTARDEDLMESIKAEVGKTFCRRCDYCQPCTNDIPISEVLHSYSLLRRQGPSYMGNGRYEKTAAWVDSCTECRECEPRCPYGLAIPDLLRQRLEEIQATLRTAGWKV
ncbi:MAG: aldo/keto reductase [Chloroflexota bacterium]